MGRTLLDSNTSFDPETLQLLCRAFDDAWQDIAGNYGHIAAEDRRTRLATVILQLANNGERDVRIEGCRARDHAAEGAPGVAQWLAIAPLTLSECTDFR